LIKESNWEDEIWEKLYIVFDNYKLRKDLKQFLYQKKDIQTNEVKEITKHSKFVNEYQRFDNTFEWFAGEMMIKKFSAFSASFGIEIKNIKRNSTNTSAGDYDSLVVLRDMNLAYFECKAGSFDESAIQKCYERMLSLNCEYSILFCVEDLNKDNIKWKSSKVKIPVVNGHQLNMIFVKDNPKDLIYDLHNCYIIDMKGSIENKIKTILRVNAAKINQLHYGIGIDKETFKNLGYIVETLNNQQYVGWEDAKITL